MKNFPWKVWNQLFQTPGHSKWEKADILEMTVQYVQCLRNQQQASKFYYNVTVSLLSHVSKILKNGCPIKSDRQDKKAIF